MSLHTPSSPKSAIQAASLVAVLLSTLTAMGGNAHISKRIISGLAAHTRGRASLRLAAYRCLDIITDTSYC